MEKRPWRSGGEGTKQSSGRMGWWRTGVGSSGGSSERRGKEVESDLGVRAEKLMETEQGR
ncbi:hypothetical protein CDL15_Pgr026391 [Punica granatum]|uniref:Uncharacterized protein n=1 Tax=Punica granatum TaxID=22663 RepID=A0A218XP94_PUNGR|nr:hypothetical protein CDL15_Pgr026391 [Punica granatum]